MPITTTAVVVEYLAIGAIAWLWFLPALMLLYPALFDQQSALAASQNVVWVVVLAVTTFLLGVVTEALSWGLEKIAVGRTSGPREWYLKVFKQNPTGPEWLAAQLWIWTSDRAEREFMASRQRIIVSRGIAVNALLAFATSWLWNDVTRQVVAPGGLRILSVALTIIGMLAWWAATYEYHARVQVAGRLRNQLDNLKAGDST